MNHYLKQKVNVMNAKERILAIRLYEKQSKRKEYFDEIGVSIEMNNTFPPRSNCNLSRKTNKEK